MTIDVLKFLQDHNIDYKITRPGWAQIHCPFGCGYPDYHLGINLDGSYGHCWRCRGKSMLSIVQKLLNCSWSEAGKILREYEGANRPKIREPEKPIVVTPGRHYLQLPSGTDVMTEKHREYLRKRKFDPELLEQIYDLRGTGHLGEYAFRIIAPIYFKRKIVSYQGRDITGKAEFKYLTCPREKEIVHHKHIVYGLDQAKSDTCIVVEGIFDGWRLGSGALSTFGTGYKTEQAQLLAQYFKRVFLLFDSEDAAQETAERMADSLCRQGIEAINLELTQDNDPGDMSQDDANALMRELGLKGWNE